MSETRASRAGIDAWRAQQLRLSFFATPDALPLHPNGWFEAVTGAMPERIEDKPKVGQHVEEGPLLDGFLSLSLGLNQINWVLESPIDPTKGFQDLPSIGSFPVVRDAWLEHVLRWVPLAPSCHRLAFGARLLLPVSSREEGYRKLGAYLPFAPDPESSSDLRYQINRHRRSTIQRGLHINRLQAWAVISLRTSLPVEGGHRPAVDILLNERWSIALDLDVNTDAGSLDKLPEDRIGALMKELADLAAEVVIEGDRP